LADWREKSISRQAKPDPAALISHACPNTYTGGNYMRALIIGGVGGMGQGVARDLVKQDKVTQVILADLYPDPERLSKKLRESDKTTLVKMDVNDHDAYGQGISKMQMW
jgi:NADP-dependent 3-hydroxy acid dehydrogenase YdfG